MMAKMAYQGIVRDRMNGYRAVYRSRLSCSWDTVQTRAEREAKKLGGGDRYDVSVVSVEIKRGKK